MFQKTLNFFLIFIIFFIFFYLPGYKVFSKEYYELKVPDEINIKLSKKNLGKYLKFQMDALLDGSNQDKKNILSKYKKPIRAKISINDDILDSKISITGDWKDHLRFPHTSLKVEILGEKNFYNIKKFKLFLPETRFAENEIFWSLMLKEIGFPVFHSQFMKVSLNNIEYTALFQEDASKEFLERNGFRETVILRNDDFHFFNSDQDNAFYNDNFSRSWLIDNEKFIKNINPYATKIVSKAISNYSNINFFKNVKDNNLFELILGKYGFHGLVHFNRKYIYEPYYNSYIPLYYDGMTSTHYKNDNKKTDNCTNPNFNKKLYKFKIDYKKLSGYDLDEDKKCIFLEIMTKKYLHRHELIEEYFFDELIYNGYQAQYKQHNKIVKIILDNINKNELILNNLISNDRNNYVYTFQYQGKYYLSLFNKLSKVIQFSEIDLDAYNTYISKNNIYSYSGRFVINLGLIQPDDKKIIDTKLNTINKNLYLVKPVTYRLNSNDFIHNEYNFYFQHNQARLLINQDSLENITLNFYNKKNLTNSNLYKISRFNDDLLTGCVTILDTKITNLNLKLDNMFCEDAINIIRSDGNIKNLNIHNSTFDALDLDYSNITINNAVIKNSGNDCIDLSFGNYNIIDSSLNNCSDKGISVGEKSIAKISNISLSDTSIAIAVKDESKVFLDDIIATNTQLYCLAAYMKKSEFDGASIRHKNISCDKNNYSDDKSMIIDEKN
tara:strand:- start:836 stop:3007 length:2172 start_codon:yes stop_codon:yes gene_type:complete